MIAARHDGEVVCLASDQVDFGRLEAIHSEANCETLTENERRRRFDTRRQHKRLLREETKFAKIAVLREQTKVKAKNKSNVLQLSLTVQRYVSFQLSVWL